MLPLFDPPREDAKSTVATAAQMGVKIKMVTGDALAIARETAKTLGMGTNILDGGILGDSRTEETAAAARSIEDADGFAQVFPEHKFHIVDVLQKHDHIVGMTGDGVNDAPALKKADCGFAVSGATDAARAAASIVLVAPGLSVIIDAIKESRKIFQRMNSYAMYRIAETLRVLLFMTLAIVVFNFYPLTAIMIVMLALLNDGAILSIAYDNVLYRNQPEAWNMRTVLGIATVLGLVGPCAAFGLFYLGDHVFHIDRPQIQTMMYLMLSVAGHLTIFQTRTRGPWWSIRPARILLLAVVGTQTGATLICVFGFLVTPLWWGWAALVWGYALAWFLVTDPVKLLAYRFLDSSKSKPHAKAEPKSEPKAEPKSEVKAEPKKETNAEPKAAAKPVAEAEPRSGAASKAKAEAPSDAKPKPDATAKSKTEPKPEGKADPNREANTGPKAAAKPGAEAKTRAQAGRKSEIKSDSVPETKAVSEAKPRPDAIGKLEPVSKAEPKPEVKAEAKPEENTESGSLLNTTLGDALLAGLVKDPEDAGRMIAAAIRHADASTAAKPVGNAEPRLEAAPETKVEHQPNAKADPQPGASDFAPRTAK